MLFPEKVAKSAFFGEKGENTGFYPFLAKNGVFGVPEGLVLHQPLAPGPCPGRGRLPRASGAPARRASPTGVDGAEREPMGSRRDGHLSREERPTAPAH